jgi:hypothetical protein
LGGQGLRTGNGPESCAFAIANWNRRFGIVCARNGATIVPKNARSAFNYGVGMRTLRQCVAVVNGIRDGAICTVQRGAPGLRIMDITTRQIRRRSFLSIDECLAALDRPRRR